MSREFISKITGEVLVVDDLRYADLASEMASLLTWFDYDNSEMGIETILNKWFTNNVDNILMMQNHPGYNGNYQVVIDAQLERKIDKNLIDDFYCFLYRYMDNSVKLIDIPYTKGELDDMTSRLGAKINAWTNCGVPRDFRINGFSLKSIVEDFNRLSNLKKFYETIGTWDCYGRLIDTKLGKIKDFMVNNSYRIFCEQFATNEMIDEINKVFPEFRANYGMKMSKIVRKLCVMSGIDINTHEFRSEYGKYADTMNPATYNETVILSINPIDYLTASFGNTWSSCHTIDKNNKRGIRIGAGSSTYQGMHASGSMSYLLDRHTFVMYQTSNVEEEWADGLSCQGNLETFAKKFRCLLHWNDGVLVQGRIYPQINDGDDGFLKQYREIAQKAFSTMVGQPNLWTKSNDNLYNWIATTDGATQYADYFQTYGSIRSALCFLNSGHSSEVMYIGEPPICPACGEEHDVDDNLNCRDCHANYYEWCHNCGDGFYEGDDYIYTEDGRYFCCESCAYDEGYHYINGYWYHEDDDDVFYCDYHEELEIGESYMAYNGYGSSIRICESAIENRNYIYCENDGKYYDIEHDDVYRCDECGDYHHVYDMIEIDGLHFCDGDCAERHGYTKNEDGEWIKVEEEEVA